MNDNLQPLGNDPLEARLTAWVLGEASPFEIAELESLVAKSPELQLFLHRTRTLHALLQEAETTANQPAEDWKLPTEKRAKLDDILGTVPILVPEKESRIRRAAFRAAWGIAAVFVVTFFSLRLLPGDYEAEAVIEIKPRERMINSLGGEMPQGSTMTPQIFGTEFEKIKSRNSLEKVIHDLDLTTRWNTDKETALKRLKASVETENLRGTDLIAIRVRQPDEQEAKEITRAVAEGYRDYLNTMEETQRELAINQFKRVVRQQEDKLEERRKVLTTISRTKKINYHGEPGMEGQGEGEKAALERSIDTTDYVDAKRDFETDFALLEQMKLKLITKEISADSPNDSIVIHDEPVITGKKFPSNPLAALKNAITPEAKSSAPLAAAKVEELQVPVPLAVEGESNRGEPDALAALADRKSDNGRIDKKQINIEGSTHTKDKVIRREVPTQPNSSNADVVAANTTPSARIPVPSPPAVAPSADFGDGDDFGAGWGSGSGGGGAPPARDQAPGYAGITKTGVGTLNLEAPGEKSNPTGEVAARKSDAGGFTDSPTPSAPIVEADPFAAAEPAKGLADRGNRSGDAAIERNTIDAILNNPEGAAADAKLAASEPAPAAAPASEMSSLAKREIIRRQESLTEADGELLGGRDAYAKGDYGQAVEKYKEALQQLPESPATADRRESYTQHLNDASIARAQELRKVGKYDEARDLLKQAETSAPTDARIKQEIAYLDDPIRTNPALTYEHQKSVEEVRRNLYKAEGNYELGKYDAAKQAYEDTLRIDPYNSAARKGIEKIDAAKSDYYRAAYDHTRAELQMEVDKAWDLEVPADLAEKKKGEANEQADPFEATGEIGSLTGLFSDGIGSDFKEGSDSTGRFNMNLRAEAERSDDFGSEFDGFMHYGAPIAGKPKQIDITTKFTEITQANDKELGFDWILPLNEDADPVTPATPTDFESRLADTTLEVDPIIGDIPIVGRLFQEKQPSLADLSQEIPAAQEPFSTFSLNISDASFQLALAAVEKGERPDPASIKPEQFYNAVDYGDPSPSSLEPVAAAIDQTAHPVIPGRNLVRVAIRTASTGRSAAQPLRLTLLVDQSGSMARADRRAAMDTALAQLATLLTENDRITVIGFSRTPRLIADSLPGNEAVKISDLVNITASEGGTNLEQALNLSSELALRHKLDGAQNRIVLFTDGAANLGDADPGRLAGRVKELRQQGLAFDIAGIGTTDTNDRLLAELARHGNGRYYLVGENTGASLAAQLAGAFRPAAENVKVQVKLNPERVGSYKLIGFEKDRLKTEDFHDDSVDAAELAADEAGVAIYQVETLPEGNGEIGEVSVRFRNTASGEMVERAWTIPHDPSAPAFDQADPKTQLATLALLAAQKLQGGPLADAIRFPDHAETIAKLKQTYANDEKAQRLLTLIDSLR